MLVAKVVYHRRALAPISRINCSTDFVELKVSRKIVNSPKVVAALDHHKLSPSAFNDVFAAFIRASSGYLNNFVISTSTTNRTAKKVRTKMFEKAKEDLKKQYSINSFRFIEMKNFCEKEVTLLQRNTLQFY